MLESIKFELYKIISKPIVKVASILVLIYLLLLPVTTYVNNRLTYGGGLSSIASKYEDGKYSEEDLSKDIENIDAKVKGKKELTKEEEFIYYELKFAYPEERDFKYDVMGKRYSYDEILAKIKAMDINGSTDTYEYKEFKKAETMISKLEIPQYKYTGAWKSINEALIMGLAILVMIIVGLPTIFNEDFANNSASVVLSTRLGKSKLPTAKVIAGLSYSLSIYVIIMLGFLLNGILNGFDGANLSLNHLYKGSPYDMSIIEMYLISLGLILLGVIVFSLIVMLLSLFIRSSMVTLGTGILIYAIPKLLMLVDSSEGILNYLRYINPTNLLEAPYLFKFYDVVNIFGQPVLVPIVLVVMAIVLGVVCSLAIRWGGKRQLL
ncbi:hypothetical protein [Clostridium sp.]|uniref:hypothetical protein n=1 Tax=Clostridium sp. TaxID=1506 RepID=UPI003217B4CC